MSLCLSFVASLVMHSVVTFTPEVPYIAEFHTQPYTSLLYIAFLEHNLLSKFRLVSSMVYFKFQIVFMQEREELRALRI
jgi:hypothetical protein